MNPNGPHQDWEPVVVRKRGGGGGGGGGGGAASTEKKFGGGGNAQKSGPGQRARKLDEATGEDGFKTEKVSMDLKIRIMKARQAKGMTQRAGYENVREAASCQPVRERGGDTQQSSTREDGKNSWCKAEGCTWAGRRQEEEEEVVWVWWLVE